MSNYIFKVGDKVSFGGIEGVVQSVGAGIYPVEVAFKSGTDLFTGDGRLQKEHTEPLLKLIEPAKTKKVLELVEVLVKHDGCKSYLLNYYPDEKDIPESGYFTQYLKTGRTISVVVEE